MIEGTVTSASATPIAPVADKAAPLGKASDLLKAMNTSEGTASPRPDGEIPGDAAPAEASLAARLIKKQRQLEKREAKFKADIVAAAETSKATSDAAANWQRLQDAKTKGGRIAALEVLFDKGEIDTELYQDLTERVYSSAAAEQPLSKADVDALVASKLEEAKAADAAAVKKVEEERTQQLTAKEQETSSGFVQYVDDAFDAAKYPTIARFAEYPELALKGEHVLEYTEECWEKDRSLPEAADILLHFEAEFRARAAKLAGTTEATNDSGKPGALPRGVSPSWAADSTPSDRKLDPKSKNYLRDSLEEAKRAAGLTK